MARKPKPEEADTAASPSDLERQLAENPIVLVPIGEVHQDPSNANTHDARSIEALKASLAKFGQTEPLLVRRSSGVIIGGNGRHRAAQELGWSHVEVRYLDVDEVTATALALALNRTQQLSEFDFQVVAAQLKALQSDDFDISVLGWQDHELEPLLAAEWSPPQLDELPGSSGGGDGESEPAREEGDAHAVVFPPSMWIAILQGIERLRHDEGDPTITEARALELIVADWMSSK